MFLSHLTKVCCNLLLLPDFSIFFKVRSRPLFGGKQASDFLDPSDEKLKEFFSPDQFPPPRFQAQNWCRYEEVTIFANARRARLAWTM